MKRRRDLRLLLAALLLLLLMPAWLFWSSRSTQKRREVALSGVPRFPAPNQPVRRKPFPLSRPSPPPPPATPALRHDAIESLVLSPGSGAMLIHLNALFNTPLFDKLRECEPDVFSTLAQMG